MAYLTFEEFEKYSLNDGMTEEEFEKLLPRASSLLDIQTNNFYVFNDMEDDYEFRVNRFKQALAAQIQYFTETGSTTHYGLNNSLQSFSAGRTSVSMKNGQSSLNNEADRKSVV